MLLIGCLDALFYEELVLFAHYVDKSMSMQCLLDTIADSLYPSRATNLGR